MLSLAPPTQPGFTTTNLLGLQTTGAAPVFAAGDGDTESEGDESDEDWAHEAVLVDRDTELTRLGEVGHLFSTWSIRA